MARSRDETGAAVVSGDETEKNPVLIECLYQ